MSQWVRLWEDTPGPPNLSDLARRVLSAAVDNCAERRSPCPQWLALPIAREDETAFCDAFQELCDARIVAEGVPSTIEALETTWPLAGYARPSAAEWQDLRRATFERDDYTCQYCGQHGGKLECDHIFPVSRGGIHVLENLATACFKCNRSKRDKTLEEWLA